LKGRVSGIEGSCYSVAIGGFRDVSIEDVDFFLSKIKKLVGNLVFQVFDADLVAGWRHLFFSAVNAVKAFETGSSVSRNLSIEALLYASCQDQISKAFEVMGVKPTIKRVALMVFADSQKEAKIAIERTFLAISEPDNSVLEINEEKLKRMMNVFGISELELEAVGGSKEEALSMFIIEKGALLPLRR
jgi:KEOPS complex subunit Cgi121